MNEKEGKKKKCAVFLKIFSRAGRGQTPHDHTLIQYRVSYPPLKYQLVPHQCKFQDAKPVISLEGATLHTPL